MPLFCIFLTISSASASGRRTFAISMPQARSLSEIMLISGKDRLYVSNSSPFSKIASGVPSSTISPLFITIALSAKSASSIKWVIRITVMPSSLFRRLTTSITSLLPLGSSIAVASSKIKTSGFIASTPATAMRCFCPPERRVGVALRYFSIPTAESAHSILLPISSRSIPIFSGPKAISSSTIDATVWLSGF